MNLNRKPKVITKSDYPHTRSYSLSNSGNFPIDLNNFTASPHVTIGATGFSATMFRSPFSNFVFLEHNPVFEPPQIFAGVGISLKFEFYFLKSHKKDDEFGVFLLNKFGVPLGTQFEFFTRESTNKIVSFDLSPLAPHPVGLVFVLAEFDPSDESESFVEITNVRLISRKSQPIRKYDLR